MIDNTNLVAGNQGNNNGEPTVSRGWRQGVPTITVSTENITKLLLKCLSGRSNKDYFRLFQESGYYGCMQRRPK